MATPTPTASPISTRTSRTYNPLSSLFDGLFSYTYVPFTTYTIGTGSATTTISIAAIPGQPLPTAFSQISALITATNSPASGGNSQVPLAAIIGGVVGGVVAIVLLGGLIFYCRRRRKVMTERDFLIDCDQPYVNQIEPYAPNTDHTPQAPQADDKDSEELAADNFPSPPTGVILSDSLLVQPSDSGYPSSHLQTSSDPVSEPSMSSVDAPAPPSSPKFSVHPMVKREVERIVEQRIVERWIAERPAEPEVEHAVDAGALLPPPPRKEILPPRYDPRWSGTGG